jgi:hypothetical protein
VGNNPVNWTDPEGLNPKTDAIKWVIKEVWDGCKWVWKKVRSKSSEASDTAKSAADRAKEIHSVLDSRAQRARTTAVTETKEGTRVVSSSERRLTPAQRAQLNANEVEGVGAGHAEVTGVNAARDMGLTPTGTAASRPICANCSRTLAEEGVDSLSSVK